MKTEHQRDLQRVRNSKARAEKAWRGEQRATYPKQPTPLLSLSPGEASKRAVARDGQRLTNARIACFQAPDRPESRQVRRAKAWSHTWRFVSRPPGFLAGMVYRFHRRNACFERAA